jgi:hypothetical protein
MNSITSKQCTKCEETKPLSNFSKQSAAKDGYRSYCKKCAKAYNKARQQKLASRDESEIDYPADKRCSDCKQTKPADKFSKNKYQKDGLHNVCCKCNLARTTAYKQKLSQRDESEIDYPADKRCSDCKQTKPADKFSKNKYQKDGLQNVCCKCNLARITAYKQKLSQRDESEIDYPADKRCSDCKQTKPADKFSKNKTRKDGLHNVCCKCNLARITAYKQKLSQRDESEIDYPADKRCSDCKQTKPADKFSKDKYQKDGLQNVCCKCDSARKNEYQKVRRKNDPEFNLICLTRSRLSKALKGEVKDEETLTILNLPENVTLSDYLQVDQWDHVEPYEVDHIIPLSKFTLSDSAHLTVAGNYRNLQLLPKSENRTKSANLPPNFELADEWVMQTLEKIRANELADDYFKQLWETCPTN